MSVHVDLRDGMDGRDARILKQEWWRKGVEEFCGCGSIYGSVRNGWHQVGTFEATNLSEHSPLGFL